MPSSQSSNREVRPVDDMLNDVFRRAALDSPPDDLWQGVSVEEAWREGRDHAVDFIEEELRAWLKTWELHER